VTGPSAAGCAGHAGLATELRGLAVAALDRLEPALERLRTAEPGAESPCVVCPVCAVVAAVRGERPELAIRLAEQASGLIEVLRAALEEGAGEGWVRQEPEPAAEPAPGRRVQRIPVERR
jgi:hypothetical protein